MSAAGMVILSPDGLLLRLVENASVWDVIFYRSIFLSMVLGGYLLYRHRLGIISIWQRMGKTEALAVILMTGSNLSFVGAIANTSVANTLVILATMPLFSAILGWLIIGEPVKPRTWVSIVLAITGIIIIFSGSMGGGNWLGDTLALATAFQQGLNLVVIRKAKERDIMMPALCMSGLLAAALVVPFAEPMSVNAHDLGVLVLMGAIIVPIALVLFLGGARHAPAAEVALLSLIETVLGPLWAWIGVNEMPDVLSFIGGFVVIIAVATNAWLGIRSRHIPING
ncbi:MAG: EamA family transporter [Rhodospirillaceae bacterium]|nr:EamA family transporter [Rhodospirillaceae bacterium]